MTAPNAPSDRVHPGSPVGSDRASGHDKHGPKGSGHGGKDHPASSDPPPGGGTGGGDGGGGGEESKPLRLAVHLGDIKSGGARCDDSYFATIATDFAAFEDPLVYTPGDNEWTDCHRVSNGAYNPLERLDAVRETFFSDPGVTLGGRNKQVLAQEGYPENQMWMESQVVFAAAHVVGSNNSYAPWIGNATVTPEQNVEADARIAADLDWIGAAFDLADAHGARGVVLMMQADTFQGSNETLDGFDDIVSLIGSESAAFARPVLLLQGDTHVFTVDHPYAAAPNLTRIVVQGETASEWLKLEIDPRSEALFSWQRIQLGA